MKATFTTLSDALTLARILHDPRPEVRAVAEHLKLNVQLERSELLPEHQDALLSEVCYEMLVPQARELVVLMRDVPFVDGDQRVQIVDPNRDISRLGTPVWLTVHRIWEISIATSEGNKDAYILQPGTYEIERVVNPLGHGGYWLVLKGTLIGASEQFWRQWMESENEFMVEIVYQKD